MNTIPRIIHYCWDEGKPFPQKLQACVDSWHRKLPGYEFRRWGLDSLGDDTPRWVREAFAAKQYAFAADFFRVYALYHFGGIYLDTDVEVLRPFDDLLELPYFLGHESGSTAIEAAVMGAAPGHPFFRAMLNYYDGRAFVRSDGSYDNRPIPAIMTDVVSGAGLRMADITSPASFNGDSELLCVLPADYFSPVSLRTMKLSVSGNTYSIHHFAATWRSPRYKFKKRLQRLLGHRMTLAIVTMKAILLRKDKK